MIESMQQSVGEWVSVDDKLPEHNGFVLLWLKQTKYAVTARYIQGCWRVTGRTTNLSKKSVSHWAEIKRPK